MSRIGFNKSGKTPLPDENKETSSNNKNNTNWDIKKISGYMYTNPVESGRNFLAGSRSKRIKESEIEEQSDEHELKESSDEEQELSVGSSNNAKSREPVSGKNKLSISKRFRSKAKNLSGKIGEKGRNFKQNIPDKKISTSSKSPSVILEEEKSDNKLNLETLKMQSHLSERDIEQLNTSREYIELQLTTSDQSFFDQEEFHKQLKDINELLERAKSQG